MRSMASPVLSTAAPTALTVMTRSSRRPSERSWRVRLVTIKSRAIPSMCSAPLATNPNPPGQGAQGRGSVTTAR